MKRREFVAALSGMLAVAACGGGAGPGSAPTEPPPPPPPPSGGPVPGANVTVNVEDNAFVDPSGGRNGDAQVTIRSGETVGWRHVGANPHTVTSSDVPSGARAFDSGTFGNNETFTVTPERAGHVCVLLRDAPEHHGGSPHRRHLTHRFAGRRSPFQPNPDSTLPVTRVSSF